MRSFKRQKQNVWHTSIKQEEIKDDDGNYTGEWQTVYAKPILYKLTVSSTVGNSDDTPYGVTVDYSRLVTSYDKRLKPKEGDMFFIDIEPRVDENGMLELDEITNEPLTKPDYVIKEILSTQKGTVARYGIDKTEEQSWQEKDL